MKKRIVICVLSLLIFSLITIFVINNMTSMFDEKVYNSIISIRNDFWDFFFKLITRFGNTEAVIGIAIISYFFLNNKDKFIIASNLIFTVSVNQVIKRIIIRPRPLHLRLIKQGGFSYPSGHAMIAIALYGTLIYFIYKYIKNKILKVLLISLLTLLILLIGISRIYVGVHFPTDILGGYFLTIVLIIGNITLVNTYLGGILNEKNDSK